MEAPPSPLSSRLSRCTPRFAVGRAMEAAHLPMAVEKEMTLQNRCEARRAGTKREPSPEGLGIHPEDDLSAVGAALNLEPKQTQPTPTP